MKSFTLKPGMTTLGGVFYPTGYMVLMYPTEQDARAAVRLLDQDGLDGDEISIASPEQFLTEVFGTMEEGEEEDLPSAGTEGDTVRRFADLARKGHYCLLVHAPSGKQSEHVMQVLAGTPIVYGQKYRHLVIEDLT